MCLELPGDYGPWCDKDHLLLAASMQLVTDFIEVECAYMQYGWCQEESRPLMSRKERFFWWLNHLKITDWVAPYWKLRSAKLGLKYLEFYRFYEDSSDSCWENEEQKKKYEEETRALAEEVFQIYIWWTLAYPNRPDPHDASGWTDWCDYQREEYGELFSIERMIPHYKGKHSLNSVDDWKELWRCLKELNFFYLKEAFEHFVNMVKEADKVIMWEMKNDYTDEERSTQQKAHKTLQEIKKEYFEEEQTMLKRLIDIRQRLWT